MSTLLARIPRSFLYKSTTRIPDPGLKLAARHFLIWCIYVQAPYENEIPLDKSWIRTLHSFFAEGVLSKTMECLTSKGGEKGGGGAQLTWRYAQTVSDTNFTYNTNFVGNIFLNLLAPNYLIRLLPVPASNFFVLTVSG